MTRKELIQQIGNIIGFEDGITLDQLVDLFIKLLTQQSEGKDK
jgi:hypothetical protein